MRKIKFNITHLLLSMGMGMGFFSCADFMDTNPLDKYTASTVWSDPDAVQAFVNGIYKNLNHGAKEKMMASVSDEAHFNHRRSDEIDVMESNVSPSNLQWYNRHNNDGKGDCPFRWAEVYKAIRYCNLFFQNIDQVPEKIGEPNLKNIMKGEVYFLRAYLYHQLIRGFGGVPLVGNKTFNLNDPDMTLARDPLEDCVDAIVDDLNEAVKLLPKQQTGANLGRATQGAALAIKARVLTHFASDLYYRTSGLGIDQPKLKPLITMKTPQQEMWRKAQAAALELMQMGEYELTDCNKDSIAHEFKKIFIQNESKEHIFCTYFTQTKRGNDNDMPRENGPNGYHTWGGNAPTQNLVNDFEYLDGSLPSGLDKVGNSVAANPYKARDPRFVATIGHDGTRWGRLRPADVRGIEPLGELQMGNYIIDPSLNDKNEPSDFYNGVDTRGSAIENWNGVYTGYIFRKFIDETIDAQNFGQGTPWIYIRYAEILLMYAEASIELGELDKAILELDNIRGRVGMPSTENTLNKRGLAMNQASLRNFLRHERRVELAFEESRYFDARRWMIAPIVFDGPYLGISVLGTIKTGKGSRPYSYNENLYNYSYKVIAAGGERDPNLAAKMVWNDKMYFAPINRDEINRHDGKLIQNPGF
ncbi:hypothetical protein AwDysgo_20620 [Bacteroidales bacterium]|nr:hypothetical protein AwDysgo_20620 [Bacteroidales bacterium]